MRYFLLALIACCKFSISIAQERYFEMGALGSMNWCWMYNETDMNAPKNFLVFKHPIAPNSFGGGIFGAWHFHEYLGVEVQAHYLTAKQEYSQDLGDVSEKANHFTRLDYIKLPILLSIHTSSEYDDQFTCRLGIVNSFLSYYSDEYHVALNSGSYINNVDRYWRGSTDSYNALNGEHKHKEGATDNKYSIYVAGVYLDIGYKHVIASNVGLQLSLFGQVDLSNPENRKATRTYDGQRYNMWGPDIKYGSYGDKQIRAHTYNIYGGVSLGIFYQFR